MRRSVVIRTDHTLAIIHLVVLEEETLVASRNPTVVAEIVRTEKKVLQTLLFPCSDLRKVIVFLRRHHAEIHVVRIGNALAAWRIAVA